LVPLGWLLAVTLTAGWQKIFAADPRLGFLAHATDTAAKVAAGTLDAAKGARMIVNDRVDAALAGIFMTIVVALLLASIREWVAVARGRKAAVLKESPYVETAYA
ncbi:MAG TPA: carbon starvation protein A, partial [Gemmatimonadales bacterium]|nr:carbon starvation protein A [Gemmatimonadales bacterium]